MLIILILSAKTKTKTDQFENVEHYVLCNWTCRL